MPIEHISDTARWVATYRAMETERADAIFRDPFARRLAGERGEEIVRAMPRGREMAWAMIVRTALFDEMILDRVRAGADLVLNLAAGLDARPWRLPLPPALRWVDVDLPGILDYKAESLRGERPACAYEAVALDLRDEAKRQALFAQTGAGARAALVIAEGLLLYLTPEQVGTLARDLHGPRSFRWWLIDIANPRLLEMMQKMWGKSVQQGNAPFRFAPAEGTAFFRPFGWREAAFRSTIEEARRLRREMRMMWLWRLLARFASRERREEARRTSGAVLLERE
ncbi:MAG TPA: class I SAM-dependent methyltransferase [Gemmatimonadaceae bacterium]|nr:class I SAM-dependent methyltransferase [Gemmatimonadaceae bacterium]